jgi:hypothetical protein
LTFKSLNSTHRITATTMRAYIVEHDRELTGDD